MADHLHRDTLISKQNDMLFDTFLNAPTKKDFSTCVQPFMLHPIDDTLPRASDDKPPMPMISFLLFCTGALHNSCLVFCTGTLHNSCLVFFFQQLLVWSILQRQIYQDKHPPPSLVSNWQGKWQMAFLVESIIRDHPFRFPLV